MWPGAGQVGVEFDPALAAARRSAGYRVDDPDAATPSVMFLNQVLAGHAVAGLVNLLSPWRTPVAYLLVDLVGSTTLVLATERNEDCPACGSCSPRALSDAAGAPEFPAPARPAVRRRHTGFLSHSVSGFISMIFTSFSGRGVRTATNPVA